MPTTVYKLGVSVFAVLVFGVILVLAHNPRVEVDDWGNFDDPYVIKDGNVSYAFFGYLDSSYDFDVFRLDFAERDMELRLRVLVPACGGHYTDYYPEVMIFGPVNNNVSVNIPSWIDGLCQFYDDGTICVESTPDPEIAENLGEVDETIQPLYRYVTMPETDERETFYEVHTRRDYYEVPRLNLDLADAGSYYLIVYDPQREGGDYLLSTGNTEQFLPMQDTEPESVVMQTDGYWLHRDCTLAPDDPNAIINVQEVDD